MVFLSYSSTVQYISMPSCFAHSLIVSVARMLEGLCSGGFCPVCHSEMRGVVAFLACRQDTSLKNRPFQRSPPPSMFDLPLVFLLRPV